MAIDRVVPSERNNTYSSADVSRKSAEELFNTAFNDDQKKALANFSPSGGGGAVEIYVTFTEDGQGGSTAVFDKTAQEVLDAFPYVYLKFVYDSFYEMDIISGCGYTGRDGCYFNTTLDGGHVVFHSDALDGYPSASL